MAQKTYITAVGNGLSNTFRWCLIKSVVLFLCICLFVIFVFYVYFLYAAFTPLLPFPLLAILIGFGLVVAFSAGYWIHFHDNGIMEQCYAVIQVLFAAQKVKN